MYEINTGSYYRFSLYSKDRGVILDSRINVLIGANDHGKTNILYAIKCLNDDNPITSDDRNWDLPETDAVKIRWHFAVDEVFSDKYKPVEQPKEDNVKEESKELSTDFPPAEPVKEEPTTAEPTYFATNDSSELVFYREGVGQPVKVLQLLQLRFPLIKRQNYWH